MFLFTVRKILKHQWLLTPDCINNMSLIALKMKTVLITLLFKPKSVEKWDSKSILRFKCFAYLKFRVEDRIFQRLVDKIQYFHLSRLFKISWTIRKKYLPNSILLYILLLYVFCYICTLCSRKHQILKIGGQKWIGKNT